MFEGHVPEKGAWRRISMTDGSVLEELILDYDPAFWNCSGLPDWFPGDSCGKVTHITLPQAYLGAHLLTRRLLRPLGLVSSIARMISNHRLPLVLLLAFGFAISSLIACSSDSDQPPAGPLRILITNDDGVGAPGIDAVVEALRDDPNNEIVVSAPAGNASGSGDWRVDDPRTDLGRPDCTNGTGEATPASTASGYDKDTWAVDGCPADSVLHALENLYLDAPPHVVLSGINEGQNVGLVNGFLLSQVSGTVGAAKTGACSGVPALASSQGEVDEGGTVNYPAGVDEVQAWLKANRAALLAGQVSVENITSINIPSCDTGAIRGRIETTLGSELPEYVPSLVSPQDCESTLEDPQDDLEAFFNGFVSVTPVPSNSNMTCDRLE